MSELLPPNTTALERAAAIATAFSVSPEPIATLWDPDRCPAAFLPWLAWALHVDNWDDTASEAQQREAIKLSVLLHRKKGTPWAVKRALATLGLEIDLIDQQAQRAIYARHNPPRLDGTWQLDGSVKIMPLADITGIPQVQHWAEFIVRLNLADVTNPAIMAKLRALIDEWKPARAWPLFVYWIRFYFAVTIGVDSRFVMQKRVFAPIWGGPIITTRPEHVWKLGRDGQYARLDGTWKLDGSVKIGKRYGGIPGPTLKSHRVASRATLVKHMPIEMRPRQRLVPLRTITTPAPVKLCRTVRKLDGTWKVGVPLRLDGTWQLDGSRRIKPHPMFTAPKLGAFKLRPPSQTIPDPTQTGRLTLDGTWKVGGPAQPESRIVSTRIN